MIIYHTKGLGRGCKTGTMMPMNNIQTAACLNFLVGQRHPMQTAAYATEIVKQILMENKLNIAVIRDLERILAHGDAELTPCISYE